MCHRRSLRARRRLTFLRWARSHGVKKVPVPAPAPGGGWGRLQEALDGAGRGGCSQARLASNDRQNMYKCSLVQGGTSPWQAACGLAEPGPPPLAPPHPSPREGAGPGWQPVLSARRGGCLSRARTLGGMCLNCMHMCEAGSGVWESGEQAWGQRPAQGRG